MEKLHQKIYESLKIQIKRDGFSEETKKKMSDSGKGRSKTEEHKRKLSESNKGKPRSKETKEKIKETRKTQIISKEHMLAFSTSQKGKIRSEEHRRKISEAKKGKPHNNYRQNYKHSPETLEKLKLAGIARRGIARVWPTSEETKRKISETLKGQIQPQKICPFCNKSGAEKNMTRYHFNNCKFKSSTQLSSFLEF